MDLDAYIRGKGDEKPYSTASVIDGVDKNIKGIKTKGKICGTTKRIKCALERSRKKKKVVYQVLL